MSRVREIVAALPDPTVKASESKLSYVECLMPNSQWSNAILLHRVAPPEDVLEPQTVVLDDLDQSAFDRTGSPLAYDLAYPELDETIVDHRNWKKREEFQLPLTTSESREALNCCLEHLSDKNWSLPLLALCDGTDDDKTVLLGTHVGNKRLTTIRACVSDTQKPSHIKETVARLFGEYTKKFSVPEHEVSTAVRSTYELCGKRPGIDESVELMQYCSVGNLSIEVNWSTLSFDAPVRDSTSILVMEIIPGWDGGHLRNLWQQLTLLFQHLNTYEQSKTKERLLNTFVSSNSTSWDEIEPLLDQLLYGETEQKFCQDDDDKNPSDVTNHVKLKKHVDNIECRQNMDSADLLWKLLKTCSNYAQMTKCVDAVLQKVQSGFARSQSEASTNSTRINNIISDIIYQKRSVPILDENLILELMIDAGLEKLSRDYIYILLSADFVNLNNVRQILSNVQTGSFTIENYRKKLTSLAKLHLCLEFTLMADNHLNCQNENIHSIFTYAFQTYVSKNSTIKSFSDLYENRLQCLAVPISTSAVQDIVKGLPTSWCATLSSESKLSTNTSSSYFSRTPILPPNIYRFDESNEHEVYCSLELSSSSFGTA